MAPLAGDAYAIDMVQVHTFLMNFVSGNDTTDAKIRGLQRPKDGRKAHKHLVEHYEGVGIRAIDILEANKVLRSLFYAGFCKFYILITHIFIAFIASFVTSSQATLDIHTTTSSLISIISFHRKKHQMARKKKEKRRHFLTDPRYGSLAVTN
jgi:hypothetical protein